MLSPPATCVRSPPKPPRLPPQSLPRSSNRQRSASAAHRENRAPPQLSPRAPRAPPTLASLRRAATHPPTAAADTIPICQEYSRLPSLPLVRQTCKLHPIPLSFFLNAYC